MTRARGITALAACVLWTGSLTAQTLVIRGGMVHTLAGAPIQNATVVMQNGKIAAVGADAAVPVGAKVIDASGLHVYPGLFDAATRLGLTEIGAVVVTVDMTELGEFNPHLVAAAAVHPASEHLPVARANGVTHAVAAPQARPGGIGGQATVVHLDGWTIEEMQIQASTGFVVNWPRLAAGGFGFGGGGFGGQAPRSFKDIKKQYDEQVRRLEGWLDAARRYDAAVKARENPPRDLKLEALARATRGELPLLVVVDQEREIKAAVEFAEKQGLKIVIYGGNDAYKLRTVLAEKKIPVILGPTQVVPAADAGYDERYASPGLLHAAGVRFAIATFGSSNSRTLPYEAGSAVSFGLPSEEALKAITLYPAQILGVADRLGTVEVGKLANLIVTDGDPLEIRTQIRHVVIAGQEASLDNRHERLYQRYRSRPRPASAPTR
ncbi:MAG TPA: amidohydrolase family protein [Gemmatimonadales bacterium]